MLKTNILRFNTTHVWLLLINSSINLGWFPNVWPLHLRMSFTYSCVKKSISGWSQRKQILTKHAETSNHFRSCNEINFLFLNRSWPFINITTQGLLLSPAAFLRHWSHCPSCTTWAGSIRYLDHDQHVYRASKMKQHFQMTLILLISRWSSCLIWSWSLASVAKGPNGRTFCLRKKGTASDRKKRTWTKGTSFSPLSSALVGSRMHKACVSHTTPSDCLYRSDILSFFCLYIQSFSAVNMSVIYFWEPQIC